MLRSLIGNEYEDRAAKFLCKQGLTLITCNYQSRYGEIDLIFQDREVLVFVEVRYRSRLDYGGAISSITAAKQRRIAKTALDYLQKHTNGEVPCRFDVIAIGGPEENTEWLRAAFDSPT